MTAKIIPLNENATLSGNKIKKARVIPLNCITKLDLPVDKVLEMAKDKLDGVVLLGYTKEGEAYFASTYADGGEVLWLLEQGKMNLLCDDTEI